MLFGGLGPFRVALFEETACYEILALRGMSFVIYLPTSQPVLNKDLP